MNVWQALLFGLVQGVTEFLPISSSGHLALFQAWSQIQEPTLFFNVFLHAASLLAIVIFFWKQIVELKVRDYWLLAIGSIPVALVGLLLEDRFSLLTSSPLLVGGFLIITGLINRRSQRLLDNPPQKNTKLDEKKALLVGAFQSLAILPGISRSGTTLMGVLSQNLEKNQAFTFTFLLGIPAILGANLLQILELVTGAGESPNFANLLAGGLAALVASWFSLGLLKKFVEQAKLKVFSNYCLAVGSLVVIAQLIL